MTQKLSTEQQALVAKTAHLVLQVVAAFRTDPTTEDELVSAGNEALTRAVLRHREGDGPFEVFARLAVHYAVLRTLGKESRARRALTLDRPRPQLSGPREVSLEDALSHRAADERGEVVVALERVTAGFLAVDAVRASRGEETILARERQQEIVRAVNGVDPEARQAFFAHLIEGKTHQECMTELGVKKRTLQRRIERAEEAVRTALGEIGPG